MNKLVKLGLTSFSLNSKVTNRLRKYIKIEMTKGIKGLMLKRTGAIKRTVILMID